MAPDAVPAIASPRRRAALGRPVRVGLALAAASAAVWGVGLGSADAAPGGATVTLKNIAFNPEVARIKAGQSVTFVWADGIYVEHNVVSTGKLRFPRGKARREGSYKVKLTKPGTYTFRCTLHAAMTGKVVVRPRG